MKRNRNWKIPRTVLERRILCFNSYKNRKLKVKLWARKRKKETTFVHLVLSELNFFNICVFSQCTVYYWVQFQNIHAFTYQKALLHTPFSMFLKSTNAFSVSLSLGRDTLSKKTLCTFFRYEYFFFKGTLMQIWKSFHILVFI